MLFASPLKVALVVALVRPALAEATQTQSPARSFDVVIYGGTAGGAIAAVSAARLGLSVALIEPSRHLGGMVTGGLSATDHGDKVVTGGYALEFYRRIGNKYLMPFFWYPEPRVAEAALNEMVAEQRNVQLFLSHRLRERGGVRKNGPNVEELVMENGARFRAKIFVEASYEGDVMKQAGVRYTVGREPSSQYGESLAGVRPKDRNHQFDYKVPARDESGTLLPEISPLPRGEIGSGDKRVQAYNFRLILTTRRANQVPFEKPAGYTPRRYEILRRFIEVVTRERGDPPKLDELLLIRADLPNAKADVNNRGPFSTDDIGASYGYPDGTYAERARIWREHVLYTKGLLYFLANDPGVPTSIRNEMNAWGLAKDEFVDNGNWPYQLYIREGRRMVGDFVMTQKDLQTDLTKPDAIAMGSYNSDSHNVQRFVQPDGSVQNEGNMEVPVQPYQIPYRVMLPRRTEATNLLVPVPFSASHVVYSSMRMEPQYMMIGQAAGVAAALAIRNKVDVHDIDVGELRRILKTQGMTDVYDSTTAPAVPRLPPGLSNWTERSEADQRWLAHMSAVFADPLATFRDAAVGFAEASGLPRLDSVALATGVQREIRIYTGFGLGIPNDVVRLWEDTRGVHGRLGVFWPTGLARSEYSSPEEERRRREELRPHDIEMRAHVDTVYDCRAIMQSRTTNVCWLAERPGRVSWPELLAKLDSVGVQSIRSPVRRPGGVDGWTIVVEVRSVAGYRGYYYWSPDSLSTDPGERAAATVASAVRDVFKRRLAR